MKERINDNPLCGFCSTGHHDQCPGGVRNGDGKIFLCQCGCDRSQQRRCTDCNTREPELVGPDWLCYDRDACAATVSAKLAANPTIQQINASRERAAQAQREERQRTAAVRVRSTSGDAESPEPRQKRPARSSRPVDCTCGCGGQTKGGKFLPGHDSKYLTILASQGDDDAARESAAQISPAFLAKLNRRIELRK